MAADKFSPSGSWTPTLDRISGCIQRFGHCIMKEVKVLILVLLNLRAWFWDGGLWALITVILSQSHPPGSVKGLEHMALKSHTLGSHTSSIASLPHSTHLPLPLEDTQVTAPLPPVVSCCPVCPWHLLGLLRKWHVKMFLPCFLPTGSVTKDAYILPCKLEFWLPSKQFISSKEPHAVTLLKYVTFKRLITPNIFILTDQKQFHWSTRY